MVREAHFWAIAYEDPLQAERLREQVTALAGEGKQLLLLDVAILTRAVDGSYTLNRKPFPLTSNVWAGGTLGFLAGVALAAPMTGAAIGSLLGASASTVKSALGMEDGFIQGVKRLIEPGTSVVLVLDEQADLEETLRAIRGLSGTVLKTNVDLERAKLIQATLSVEPSVSSSTLNGGAK